MGSVQHAHWEWGPELSCDLRLMGCTRACCAVLCCAVQHVLGLWLALLLWTHSEQLLGRAASSGLWLHRAIDQNIVWCVMPDDAHALHRLCGQHNIVIPSVFERWRASR